MWVLRSWACFGFGLALQKLMRLGVGGELGTAPLAIIVPSSCSWEFERQQSFCCFLKKKAAKATKAAKERKGEEASAARETQAHNAAKAQKQQKQQKPVNFTQNEFQTIKKSYPCFSKIIAFAIREACDKLGRRTPHQPNLSIAPWQPRCHLEVSLPSLWDLAKWITSRHSG